MSPLNDDDDEEEFEVLDAKNGEIKYIYRIAMMAGTQRQDAVNLMKKSIGISNDQEKYIIDLLTRMARPDSSKDRNPYSRRRGHPVGGKNSIGHNAGRKPTKKPARGQQQLTFAGAIEYESVGNANDTVPSSFSTHQLTAAAQAATGFVNEKLGIVVGIEQIYVLIVVKIRHQSNCCRRQSVSLRMKKKDRESEVKNSA